jgi:hypothetical protein
MRIDKSHSALVVIDPPNDVMGENGGSGTLIGGYVKDNSSGEIIARLLRAAKGQGFRVFISSHDRYPADRAWRFGGAVK